MSHGSPVVERSLVVRKTTSKRRYPLVGKNASVDLTLTCGVSSDVRVLNIRTMRFFTDFVPSSHSNASGLLLMDCNRSHPGERFPYLVSLHQRMNSPAIRQWWFYLARLTHVRKPCFRGFAVSSGVFTISNDAVAIDWSVSVISLIMRYDRRCVAVLKLGVGFFSKRFGKRSGCATVFHCFPGVEGGGDLRLV